jgi:hypothetical protein
LSIAFPVVVVVIDIWAPSLLYASSLSIAFPVVVVVVDIWVPFIHVVIVFVVAIFFCCRSMALVIFVVWAAVYLAKAVSKDIGVRGEGIGMADDAATTIAVSPTPPGAADASLPLAAFRGTWTMGEDDSAPNPMPPNPGEASVDAVIVIVIGRGRGGGAVWAARWEAQCQNNV